MDQDQADELFAAFGPVRVKRMFGGHGLYADGVMFGLVADDEIFLKAGPSNAPDFDAEGLGPFAYDTKTGRHVMTSYRRAPERALDDPDEMAAWARRSLAAAKAGKTPKPRSEKRPRKNAAE
ncbi:TfoX/Sxy family protein [Chenggangzhangella methanolivorans]|uniref:TfoX/Sxy family protein n=1 Tax=Chenggangzhangella methanolivorans TaxID=1437009 RepID=A0A9E6R9M0_9HYPH|nr:TfoX/Sxy family protein [Chenggangzhangella methanolivorans]QZO00087.1 TfoX/Sxy family protein [Chenggangzhangella methanolivorans]